MDGPVSGLTRAIGVRPGEGRRLASVAALFALVETGRAFGEIGVETLVLGRYGPTGLPSVLPFLYMGLGATGLIVALAYTAALGRVTRARLFIGLLSLGAALIIGWRVALGAGVEDVLLPLWLTIYVIGSIVVTVYWTVAGATFDARQAKRLFPLLTAAAIAGAFVGSLLAGPVAGLIGAANLVLIEAAAMLLALPLLARLVRRPRPDGRLSAPVTPRRRRSALADLRAGFDVVAASPMLRRIAIAYVLLAVLMFSVQYPFTISAAATFPTDTERATALGVLSAVITATSFLVSVFVANRVFARFGVSAGAVLLPIVYLVGFGVWLVQFSFPTAAAFRASQQVTQRGLSNASWSAFYNVVPADRRAQVLAFNDGVPGQLGTILSGLLLLAAGRILAPEQFFWLGVIAAIVAIVVVVGIRRRYGASLVAALRDGAAEQVLEGGPGVAALMHDPSVVPALVEAAGAPEPGVRELAAAMLGEVDTPMARAALVRATLDADADVRVAAVRALGRSRAGLTAEARDIEALEADPDPRVRASVVVARAGRDQATVLALVGDPDPAIRTFALQALLPAGRTTLDPAARSAAIAALDDEAARVRAAAAAVLGADDGPVTELLDTVEHGWRRPSTAALDALAARCDRAGQDPAIRPVIRDFALRQVERTTGLRQDRRALAASPIEAERFLVDVLAARERDLLRSLLGALAVLGARDAPGLIRRSLAADDPEIRAQAIEALESLGDRQLAGRVVRFLEDADLAALPTRDAVLERLAHDEDPWLRRLAQACRGEPVADATRSLSALETMLALRRVPLFEGLAPEDLQRIASSAVERVYAADEALITEGDLSDELVVLLDGAVRVERAEPDGSVRFIRTYEAGEHIGELAVLRERPRVASVIAQDGGARGLVVAGSGLKAILRERPDAAMAMLATLAERLSRQ